MLPDSEFAHPIGSFGVPLDIPEGTFDSTPLAQVCFSRAYVPYVLGALKQLMLQSTWKYTTREELDFIQQNITELMDQFADPPVNPLCSSGPSVHSSDWGLQVSDNNWPAFSHLESAWDVNEARPITVYSGYCFGLNVAGTQVDPPYGAVYGALNGFWVYPVDNSSYVDWSGVDHLGTTHDGSGYGTRNLNDLGFSSGPWYSFHFHCDVQCVFHLVTRGDSQGAYLG